MNKGNLDKRTANNLLKIITLIYKIKGLNRNI